MAKRGNGEGSITKRKDGRYMARYTVQTPEGPKQKTITGKKGESRDDVAARLTKAMADRDGGLVYDAGTLTVAEYLGRWLSDSVRDTVRVRTYERYEQIVRSHLTPAFGRMKLKNLTPAHVRGLYREKLDAGLSPRTVQYIHVTLHKALRQAVADGLIPRNVTEAVKAPRPEGKEVNPLTADQVRALLSAASGDRLEALYVLAVSAGLRQGELLGLRWEDIDLEAATLQVRRTLSNTRDGLIFAAPKTSKGRRKVSLTAPAVDALRRHSTAQKQERLAAGPVWEDQGLVFPNTTGGLMHPWTLTGGSYGRLLRRAGLPETTRFHDLRHTCATLLLSKGTHPKIVQEMLGHATISITLDTYSHVLPNMQGEAVSAMESAIG